MTNREQMREQIRSMRGEFATETIYTHEIHGRTIEIVAYGFENYPEADFYRVHDNGAEVMDAIDGNTPFNAVLRAFDATKDPLFVNIMEAIEGVDFSW